MTLPGDSGGRWEGGGRGEMKDCRCVICSRQDGRSVNIRQNELLVNTTIAPLYKDAAGGEI
jgi:hypothetical protein